jgi:hydrogenase maturation protease
VSRTLVAGIGNIFLSDDGFGVEVAARLADEPVPDGVRVEDFGIRGVHLAYELLDGYDALVLVDAVPMGEPPGTVAIVEPELGQSDRDSDGETPPVMDAHSMNPAIVLDMLASLGGEVGRVLVVGCQPSVIDEHIGLSAPVAAAVDRAVEAVLETLTELSPSGAGAGVDQSGDVSEERSRA